MSVRATGIQTPGRHVLSLSFPISSPFALLTRSHATRPTSPHSPTSPTCRGTKRTDSGDRSFSLLGYLPRLLTHLLYMCAKNRVYACVRMRVGVQLGWDRPGTPC